MVGNRCQPPGRATKEKKSSKLAVYLTVLRVQVTTKKKTYSKIVAAKTCLGAFQATKINNSSGSVASEALEASLKATKEKKWWEIVASRLGKQRKRRNGGKSLPAAWESNEREEIFQTRCIFDCIASASDNEKKDLF